jgi:ADP-glucose pyrophosphorylase
VDFALSNLVNAEIRGAVVANAILDKGVVVADSAGSGWTRSTTKPAVSRYPAAASPQSLKGSR